MAKLTAEEMLAPARAVVDCESQAVAGLKTQLTAQLATVAQMLLDCPGHVLIAGAGTSRAVAQRFAHLLGCCGTPALFFSAADAVHGGAGSVTNSDVLYVISKGGHSAGDQVCPDRQGKRGQDHRPHGEPGFAAGQDERCDLSDQGAGDVDPYGMIATGSSLVNGAACDVFCVLLLEMRGYSKEQFGVTHPEGAVGKKLAERESEGLGR